MLIDNGFWRFKLSVSPILLNMIQASGFEFFRVFN